MRKLALVLGALLVVSCTSSKLPHRSVASVVKQPPTEPNETWTSTDETNSADIVGVIEQLLVKRTGNDPTMKRDAHPKHHGCVKGFFKIEAEALADSSRVGLFAHNQEEFKAWIRFSNGDPDSTKPDGDGDVRGMAVKLMGLPEASFLAESGAEPASGVHDLLLMNSPVFFIHDTAEYKEFMDSVASGTMSLGWFLATHWTTAKVLLNAKMMNVGNPLHLDYYSATPYKLGNGAMKFMMRSCIPPASRDTKPSKAAPNFLKDRLVATLGLSEGCFDFLVQESVDALRTPIEDPTRRWDERLAPFVKVATLRIPVQTGIDTPEQMTFCENLSFDPWRALPANRPLGAINRVRLQAYGHISALRHDHNHVPIVQPTE